MRQPLDVTEFMRESKPANAVCGERGFGKVRRQLSQLAERRSLNMPAARFKRHDVRGVAVADSMNVIQMAVVWILETPKVQEAVVMRNVVNFCRQYYVYPLYHAAGRVGPIGVGYRKIDVGLEPVIPAGELPRCRCVHDENIDTRSVFRSRGRSP